MGPDQSFQLSHPITFQFLRHNQSDCLLLFHHLGEMYKFFGQIDVTSGSAAGLLK